MQLELTDKRLVELRRWLMFTATKEELFEYQDTVRAIDELLTRRNPNALARCLGGEV